MRRLCLHASLLLAVLAGGCSERSYDAITPQSPGAITASARHLIDREGDLLSVGVWGPGIEWTPETGAELASAYAMEVIDSSDYSMTRTMTEMDREGSETGVTKLFEPGDYSVVFFVGEPAEPCDRFAKIRIHVNGDMTVVAPDSSDWTSAAR